MPQPPNARIVKKVKKLSEIAEALRQGERYPGTRLTIIKSLCQEPDAAAAFAWFLAQRIQSKMRQQKCPKTFRQLVDRAVKELRPYSPDPTEERKARLSSLCQDMKAEQNEYKKTCWNIAQLLKSRNLDVVEQCLRSVLRTDEAPYWVYHAARDFAMRYDAQYWSGLMPSSAPMVEEIVEFWCNYFGIKE